MKKVEAIINPFELDELRETLALGGVEGMTISEVRGHVPHCEERTYRGVQYSVDEMPKIKVEVVVGDEQVAPVIGILESVARANQGDHMIVVFPVDDAIRIRTGERGAHAIDRGIVRRGVAA